MKWMKERDLLIAQTMAFVQSVTGKMPDTEKTIAPRFLPRRDIRSRRNIRYARLGRPPGPGRLDIPHCG